VAPVYNGMSVPGMTESGPPGYETPAERFDDCVAPNG
jgi:hypothetical protein